MISMNGNTHTERRNGRFLATSIALHAVLFISVTFLAVEKEIELPLPMSVTIMLNDENDSPISKSVDSKPQEVVHQPVSTPPVLQQTPEIIKEVPVVENSKNTIESIQTPPQPAVSAMSELSKTSQQNTPVTPVSREQKSGPVQKVCDTPATPANFNAAYLNNPKPSYPKISKRLGEEGTTILKVKVLADGSAGLVMILQSSNFERLDAGALEAVKKWRFVAATQGGKAVESWVSVPVSFKING
jgi:periplasmic protein TonB